ncbi:BTAD domain-containing putative transcriptional regulator [Paractinoplanes atraurantiacus]|uniref:BTAD domain-containing putative transcriptional regulator n=1 Tax=Paractinoplanes atraurantiacus TaxID=1036182 RepID=UPI0015CF3F82|nr:BTAD domain-containing putative transcriptional regulator [Actinoplanes atraurantiacus]
MLREGTPVDLGPAKQRAVLAVLLLHAGRPVPTHQIVDAVWGDDPPENGANVVQKYVAGLRRVLDPSRAPRTPGELLALTGSGYVLRITGHSLDADEFLAALAASSALAPASPFGIAPSSGASTSATSPSGATFSGASPAAALRAALDLWRGEALAGLSGAVFEAARMRLTEAKATAWERWAELSQDRDPALIPELTRLIGEFPLREGLRAQLMVALYRNGRQAEALATFREARSYLLDEFGIEPGELLQETHRRILRGEPLTTDSPARPSAPAPAAPSLAGPATTGIPDGSGTPSTAAPASPGIPGAPGTPSTAGPATPGIPGAPGTPSTGAPATPGIPDAPGTPPTTAPTTPGIPGAPGTPSTAGPATPGIPGAPGSPSTAAPATPGIPGTSDIPSTAAPAAPGISGGPGAPSGLEPLAAGPPVAPWAAVSPWGPPQPGTVSGGPRVGVPDDRPPGTTPAAVAAHGPGAGPAFPAGVFPGGGGSVPPVPYLEVVFAAGLPLVTLSLGSWIYFAVAAARHRDRRLIVPAVIYFLAVVVAVIAMGVDPTPIEEPESLAENIGILTFLVTIFASSVHGAVVATHSAAKTRAWFLREQFRLFAALDPGRARHAGVGLPGVSRPYDDGGLIDINHVTVDDLVRHAKLSPSVAESIAAARPFRRPDELVQRGLLTAKAYRKLEPRLIAL